MIGWIDITAKVYPEVDLKSNSFRAIRASDRQFATVAKRVCNRRKLTISRTIDAQPPTGMICPANQTAPKQVIHCSIRLAQLAKMGPSNPRANSETDRTHHLHPIVKRTPHHQATELVYTRFGSRVSDFFQLLPGMEHHTERTSITGPSSVFISNPKSQF